MKFFTFSYIAKLVILFVLYFLGGLLGLFLNAATGKMTLFWPPLGIALAMVLLFGYRMWPAIFVASLLLVFSKHFPLPASLLIATTNVIDILLVAYIFRRFSGTKQFFSGVNDVISFAFIAVPLGAAVAATLGVIGMMLGTHLPTLPFYFGLRWWASDILSYVIMTPLFLAWYTNYRFSYSRSQIVELVLLIIFSFYCALFTFTNVFVKSGPMTYMAFPPVLWAALRFGQRETMTIVFVFCIVAIWNTLHGVGPFVGSNTGETLAHVQSFMSILGISSLMLASLMNERKELEKRKDDFIGIASHELKTPLTSIKAYVQIIPDMIKQKQDKTALLYLTRMDEQIDKLAHLVGDLLNISKIQAGKLELRETVFDLSLLVDETIKTIQSLSSTHTIHVRGKISKKVYADKEKIGQVLSNLISNAIRYSSGADQIIVRLTREKDFVKVSVQDFGIGIPGNKLHQIFNRFYQLERNGGARGGFGLGLYISSEIIRLHNGKIWAESVEGKGSTFCFTLPLKK